MDATPALILTRHELSQLVNETAQLAADRAVDNMKSELRSDPIDRVVHQLREYMDDQSTVSNPREFWANGHHIRRIELNGKGVPKSMGWFMHFKRCSGLHQCLVRSSARHGRLQEWTFEDIALCWKAYYGKY